LARETDAHGIHSLRQCVWPRDLRLLRRTCRAVAFPATSRDRAPIQFETTP
jgi:hypothetical protein